MKNWNLVISVYQEGLKRVVRALRDLGPIEPTSYHNVLVMRVQDPMAVLAAIEERAEADPALHDSLSRVAPAMRSLAFSSPEEFESKAGPIVLEWLPSLAGKSFHVRMHRRGPKHARSEADSERSLGEVLADALRRAGTPGSISFSDPDAVIAIDTIDDRAGIALWTRADLHRHPLLRPD